MFKNKIYIFLAVISLQIVSIEAMWPWTNKENIPTNNIHNTTPARNTLGGRELTCPTSSSPKKYGLEQSNHQSEIAENFEDLGLDPEIMDAARRDGALRMVQEADANRCYESDSEEDDEDIKYILNSELPAVRLDFKNPFDNSQLNESATMFWAKKAEEHTPVRKRKAEQTDVIMDSLQLGHFGTNVRLVKENILSRALYRSSQIADTRANANTCVERRFDIEPSQLSSVAKKGIITIRYDIKEKEFQSIKNLCNNSLKMKYFLEMKNGYTDMQKAKHKKNYPSFQEMYEGKYKKEAEAYQAQKKLKDEKFLENSQDYLPPVKQAFYTNSSAVFASLASLWLGNR